MAKTYRVTVCRTAYAFKEFEIKADSQKAAEAAALEMAGNYEYSEKDAEYSISGTFADKEAK